VRIGESSEEGLSMSAGTEGVRVGMGVVGEEEGDEGEEEDEEGMGRLPLPVAERDLV